ncbi:MMPL family transporter [Swaminathania salitolerans]|uniref:RND transporter n=1 Tax=Swaminathania salitolerans TaxID=182838 RepID=A0A511BRX6_9PROT|nr:MMPL family transporter [Swaminathania salitolerans]GEL02374.1 RND transporter [Swaminathania salitolerans]
MLASSIGRIVALCTRRAWGVVLLFALLTGGSLYLTAQKLGVTTNTDEMFASSLPWKQRNAELTRLFPQNDDLMVAIIKADLPEQGRETARALAKILSRDHRNFRSVRLPDDSPFLQNHGLLYLDKPTLASLLDSIVAAQPFLGTLAADPSARGIFSALGLMGDGLSAGEDIPESFTPELRGFAQALTQAADGHPRDLSWQNLLTGPLGDLAGNYQYVLTQPHQDFDSLQPGGEASAAMRRAIDSLPFVRSGNAIGMITGPVQLSDEEFATVAHGMGFGLLTSLVLVACWLVLAVRSVRVIVPILVTLVIGLLLTTGFAAIAVGKLNLISVAFAVLFVGIAVDFAIQFSVRFRGQRLPSGEEMPTAQALAETGRETGHQILVASLATAAGFLAFVPTSFVGVAQLGLIAGIGMLIAFVCTMTLLPALLHLFRARLSRGMPGFASMAGADHFLRHHRKPILAVFAILAVVGVALIPRLTFDADPLHTKNPNTEGMRALHLLEQDPRASPYDGEVIVPNLTIAAERVRQFEALPSVESVMWLGMFVPEDQDQKIAMIRDTATILLPTIVGQEIEPAPDAEALRKSAAQAAAKLGGVLDRTAPDSPLRTIQKALARLSSAPDAQILAANEALTRFLPAQLSELRDVLQPTPVTIGSIPKEIARDYLLPDGRALLKIMPKGRMSDNKVLYRFLDQMQSVDKNVAGTALEVVESARTMVNAFSIAAISALVMIAIILFIALRRLQDMALVLAPLMMSALLTVILIVTVPETLNFANIIALPLLLGVGVSFNIYFVMNWRAGIQKPLTSPTARAVLFSALTTGTAFGSLAASEHPGTASMGRLLLMSLACTLIATLVFIPALLPKRAIDKE